MEEEGARGEEWGLVVTSTKSRGVGGLDPRPLEGKVISRNHFH